MLNFKIDFFHYIAYSSKPLIKKMNNFNIIKYKLDKVCIHKYKVFTFCNKYQDLSDLFHNKYQEYLFCESLRKNSMTTQERIRKICNEMKL